MPSPLGEVDSAVSYVDFVDRLRSKGWIVWSKISPLFWSISSMVGGLGYAGMHPGASWHSYLGFSVFGLGFFAFPFCILLSDAGGLSALMVFREGIAIKRAQAKLDAAFLNRLEGHWGVLIPSNKTDRKKFLTEIKSASTRALTSVLQSGRLNAEIQFLHALLEEVRTRLAGSLGAASEETKKITQFLDLLEGIQAKSGSEPDLVQLLKLAETVSEVRADLLQLGTLAEFNSALGDLNLSKRLEHMDQVTRKARLNFADYFFRIQGEPLTQRLAEKLLKKSGDLGRLEFFEVWHLFAVTANQKSDLRWPLHVEFEEQKQSRGVRWVTGRVTIALPEALVSAKGASGFFPLTSKTESFGFQIPSGEEWDWGEHAGAVDGMRRAVGKAVQALIDGNPALQEMQSLSGVPASSETLRKNLCATLFGGESTESQGQVAITER